LKTVPKEFAWPAVPPPRRFDIIIDESDDWRGEKLARLRAVVLAADPAVVEEVKRKKPHDRGASPYGLTTGSSGHLHAQRAGFGARSRALGASAIDADARGEFGDRRSSG
jgi:hypothetical protein